MCTSFHFTRVKIICKIILLNIEIAKKEKKQDPAYWYQMLTKPKKQESKKLVRVYYSRSTKAC